MSAPSPAPEQVLACPMSEANDAGAATVGDYLVKLLQGVWEYGEGFSGKRPFGNSGWEWEVYEALAHAGLIKGTFDDYGYLSSEGFDRDGAHALVSRAIERLLDGWSRARGRMYGAYYASVALMTAESEAESLAPTEDSEVLALSRLEQGVDEVREILSAVLNGRWDDYEEDTTYPWEDQQQSSASAPSDPENDVARDPDTGECRVCRAAPDEPHDQADHDNFWAAEDATWD